MFAVLYIADFALHAVLRAEPGTTGRPAALFTPARQKSIVLSANPGARAHGVEPGMSAPQAMARCPQLVIRTSVAGAEAEARAALFAVGFTLSPAIEDTAPGVCTVDLKGVDPARLEPAAAMAARELTRLGLPATAGIGRTPLLALYAARAAAEEPARSSFPPAFSPPEDLFSASCVAEAAPERSEQDEPSHRLLRVTDAPAFLAPLPLAAADPSPELAGILAQWGVRTLGELTALPRDDVGRRLGPDGLALWDRARGGDPRPLRQVTATRDFSAMREFEDEVESLEPLLFSLRRFLDRLALELRTAQLVAAELELTLSLGDGTRHVRGFRLPEPTADVDILFRTLHTHLESLQTAASISAVALRLMPTRPLVRQQGLFDTGLRDPHGFAETLARVSALVGAGRVGTPECEPTHRPDAVRLVTPAPVVPLPPPPPVHPPRGLPLRRFRPPLAATLEFAPPGRQPIYLHTSRFHGAIAEIHGPWRGSGDWWEPDRAWERIEYDIELAAGGLYRLIQTGEAWFIEGEYD